MATTRTLRTRAGMVLAATALALPALAGTASASVPIPGASSGCQALFTQFNTLVAKISSLSSQANGLEGTPLAALLTQIQGFQNQLNGVSQQLQQQACS